MSIIVETPFQNFTGLDGKPLTNGKVYIGQVGTDPTVLANQIPVFWDEALTIPASQPLTTNAGYIVRFGTPARVYCAGNYSISVKNASNVLVYYLADTETVTFVSEGELASSNGASMIGWQQNATGSVLRTVSSRLAETISIYDFGTQAEFDIDTGPALTEALAFANLNLSTGRRAVYFPAGVYVFQSGITLPSGCAIIGEEVPRAAQPGDWINGNPSRINGTTFWTNASAGNAAGPAFIRMSNGSACENINVWYTGQTRVDNPALIVAYPPTFLISTETTVGNSDNVVIRNCSALNCYDFINIGDGTNPVGRGVIENCFANPYHGGMKCRTLSGDVFMISKVFIENLFTTTAFYMPNINNHIRDNVTAFDLSDCQGINLTDCIGLACYIGIYTNSMSWAQVTNCLFDYCALPGYFNGADRVMISNTTFVNNYRYGPAAHASGAINGLSLVGCFFGDYYPAKKTGLWCSHTSGTVKVSSSTFSNSFPAILNTGIGAVAISSSGVGYDRVTGDNISVDGGPALAEGVSLNMANISPVFPEATGWIYNTPANFQSLGGSGGIRIQGAGNNTFSYRPASISGAESDKMTMTVQILRLVFNLRVLNQGGSPKLEILILDDSSNIVADAFQVSQDSPSADSGLPENEVLRICLVLPWPTNARILRFQLPSQIASTVYEITTMNITTILVPRGSTGLEFFRGKTLLPGGYYDAQTGSRVVRMPVIPTSGSWTRGDRIITPAAIGQPKGAERLTTGSGNVLGVDWASTGNL